MVGLYEKQIDPTTDSETDRQTDLKFYTCIANKAKTCGTKGIFVFARTVVNYLWKKVYRFC
jgi:hypothetical protein